ncbi:excalibur calcium-binding domain-containing protein [Pseudidiomarina taiwanensis]|uniref:Calcium-binding protein n=1 Tax=Pseudidiomarina taiwanensis TaxID=337250 RepID=A0A432ZN42_9GAMM|nr:excalibur calcium-binding domain-containing protein [Pseudidiomarina taiwanensis]RUO79307.1 calcium-binding protein [Pseudidiomarina taiwanensis]
MRKLIILLMLAAAVLQFYRANGASPTQGFPSLHEIAGELVQPKQRKRPLEFMCDGRRYCSQMTSREEAENFLAFCPDTQLDANQNGIPCEDSTRF